MTHTLTWAAYCKTWILCHTNCRSCIQVCMRALIPAIALRLTTGRWDGPHPPHMERCAPSSRYGNFLARYFPVSSHCSVYMREVSLHMCVLPYKYRKIIANVARIDGFMGNTGSRPRQSVSGSGALRSHTRITTGTYFGIYIYLYIFIYIFIYLYIYR